MDTTTAPVIKYDLKDEDTLLLLLRTYYSRLFPFKQFVWWLNYGPRIGNNIVFREFSFTLHDDIYLRYQSFRDAEEMRSEILRLCPIKVDIGAIYNARPKDKKSLRPQAFQPQQKELVFDIDMTDYDDIRTCCSGSDICRKCWVFMTIAIKVIDRALREDFGFRHLMWIYSGRRGVHCWVCDPRARALSNEARKAIVGWLEVVKGGSQQARKVDLRYDLQPSLKRAAEICEPYFYERVLPEQGILASEAQWKKVLRIIEDADVCREMENAWAMEEDADPIRRWKQLRAAVKAKTAKGSKQFSLMTSARDAMLQYTYPRLDDKVTTQLNHLLKSPFCVHPKTGRICVPIDPTRCDDFDPMSVPTIVQLVEELDAQIGGTDLDKGKPNTSLDAHVEYFARFVQDLWRAHPQDSGTDPLDF